MDGTEGLREKRARLFASERLAIFQKDVGVHGSWASVLWASALVARGGEISLASHFCAGMYGLEAEQRDLRCRISTMISDDKASSAPWYIYIYFHIDERVDQALIVHCSLCSQSLVHFRVVTTRSWVGSQPASGLKQALCVSDRTLDELLQRH